MIIKKWRAYFSNQSINLSKYGIVPLINIQKGEGFWGYSDRDVNLSIDDYNLSNNNISLKNGWQIISFSSAFEPKYINAKIIWGYDNNWSYYSNKYDFNISKMKILTLAQGYFILK